MSDSSPMKMHPWLLTIALALMAGPISAKPSGCGLPPMTGASALHRFLSLRAVEVVKLAAGRNDKLEAWIAPSARFELGAGDMGRPLGTGIDGARELARTMHADTYRFLGWDYMDMPVDPCSKQQVEVEFIDSQGRNVSRVVFTFEGGRVVGADGWERSFETGPL